MISIVRNLYNHLERLQYLSIKSILSSSNANKESDSENNKYIFHFFFFDVYHKFLQNYYNIISSICIQIR